MDAVKALIPLKAAFPRVLALLQLALTLPVSTASCERSFSCIKTVKTYARTSMTEDRLSGLGLMSVRMNSHERTLFWIMLYTSLKLLKERIDGLHFKQTERNERMSGCDSTD